MGRAPVGAEGDPARFQRLPAAVAVLGADEIEGGASDHLLARTAVLGFSGAVCGEHFEGLRVEDRHGDRIAFEQKAKRGFAPAQLGDVHQHVDPAPGRQGALLDADPALMGQRLLERALAARTAGQALLDPGLLPADSLGIFARCEAELQQIDERNAGREGVRHGRMQVGVAAVPQHQAVLGVEEGQALGHGVHRLAQARVRLRRLGVGARERLVEGGLLLGAARVLGADRPQEIHCGSHAMVAAVLDDDEAPLQLGGALEQGVGDEGRDLLPALHQDRLRIHQVADRPTGIEGPPVMGGELQEERVALDQADGPALRIHDGDRHQVRLGLEELVELLSGRGRRHGFMGRRQLADRCHLCPPTRDAIGAAPSNGRLMANVGTCPGGGV